MFLCSSLLPPPSAILPACISYIPHQRTSIYTATNCRPLESVARRRSLRDAWSTYAATRSGLCFGLDHMRRADLVPVRDHVVASGVGYYHPLGGCAVLF